MWYCIASHMLSQLNYIQAAFQCHHLFAVICARAKLNMWSFFIAAFNISALLNLKEFSYTPIQHVCMIYIPQVYGSVGLVVRWLVLMVFHQFWRVKFLFSTGLLCYFRCCQYDSWLCILIVMFPVFSSKQDQVSRPLHAKCVSLYGMAKKLFFSFFSLHSTKQKQRSWFESAETTFCYAESSCFFPFSRFLFLKLTLKPQKSTGKNIVCHIAQHCLLFFLLFLLVTCDLSLMLCYLCAVIRLSWNRDGKKVIFFIFLKVINYDTVITHV